jgi:hypothetical protein
MVRSLLFMDAGMGRRFATGMGRRFATEKTMTKGSLALAGLLLVTSTAFLAPAVPLPPGSSKLPMGSPVLLAQERRIEEADLPRWVQDYVVDFFNDPSTIHFSGRTRIPSTRVIVGDVAALGGPFTMAGEVHGDLVVVNGDLVLEAGGSVRGNVLVVGGRVLGEDLGLIGGNLRVFPEPLRYVRRGERIQPVGRPGEREGFGPDFPWGDVRLTVKAGQNYNRIEGLPVMFGPSIRTAGANPSRLDLYGIWRTEMGVELGREDFGYAFRAEQALGGRNRMAVGGTLYSMVEPVEDWGISNLEASLATFILHKDFRDYYERTGWSAYGRFRFPFHPVEIRAEFFSEDHAFARVAGPWSLTKNQEPWREQPLVAEGGFRFLQGSLIIDTRNDQKDPTDGWYIQAMTRRGLGGELIRPAHFSSSEAQADSLEASEFDTAVFTGFVDLRVYKRINPGSSLNFRGLLGGAMSNVPLPPQYQHALGGVGSLPGFPLFYEDCGARTLVRGRNVGEGIPAFREGVFPSYGCDRFALFQTEFRRRLFADWGLGEDPDGPWDTDRDWFPHISFSPEWTAFFDAGRGWRFGGHDARTLMDAGLGIYLGDLGVFYAVPLNKPESTGRSGTFFIRLSRRF